MDRFCDKCGSLVSGNGKFCPLCGAKMGFELNISSDLDVDTSSSFLDELDTSLPEISDTKSPDNAVSSTAVPQPAIGAPKKPNTDFSAQRHASQPTVGMRNTPNTNISAQRHVPQGYVPQYMPQQPYMQPSQPYRAVPQTDVEKLTMGQWLGTLFLSTCLGAISIVLLILWGFANGSKEPRKSFARAMLIVVPIFYIVVFFGIGFIIQLADL